MITKEELREYREAFEKVSAGSRRQRELEERRHSDISFLLQENAKLRQLVLDYDSSLNEALRLAHVQGTATIGDLTQIIDLRLRRLELGVVACDD